MKIENPHPAYGPVETVKRDTSTHDSLTFTYATGTSLRIWLQSDQSTLVEWRSNGSLHRVGGPARMFWDDTGFDVLWHHDGARLHACRNDGLAQISSDGSMFWRATVLGAYVKLEGNNR